MTPTSQQQQPIKKGRKVKPAIFTMQQFTLESINQLNTLVGPSYKGDKPPNNDYVLANRIKEAGLLPAEYEQKVSYGIKTKINQTKFQEPVTQAYKGRLGNMYEFDYIARSVTDTLVYYLLGREPRGTLYSNNVNRYRQTNNTDNTQLNDVIDPQVQQDLQKHIDSVDHISCIYDYDRLGAGIKNEIVYGRGALLKKFSKDDIQELDIKMGAPIDVKPLCGYYLGQNIYDVDNWDIEAVTYNDTIFGVDPNTKEEIKSKEIPIQRLVYLTKYDDHILPNSYGYGSSTFHTILSLSEINRNLNRRIFPELINSQFCGSGMWKAEGMSYEDMRAIANNIRPGTHSMSNQDLTFEQIKLDYDLQGLLALRRENVLQMLIQLKLPSVLANFEEVTNRATIDKVLLAWQQTVLEGERQRLRKQLWEYWYAPIVDNYFGGDAKPLKYKFIHLRLKVLTEFQNVAFDDMIDKAQAISILISSNVISPDEGRSMLYLPPFPKDVQEQFAANEKMLQDQQQTELSQQDQLKANNIIDEKGKNQLDKHGNKILTVPTKSTIVQANKAIQPQLDTRTNNFKKLPTAK